MLNNLETKTNKILLNKRHRIVINGLKLIMYICFIASAYMSIGFPIEEQTFYQILPSIITITAAILVFYNVNRTQQKNYENETKKFRRDARTKSADEILDCLAIFKTWTLDLRSQKSKGYSSEASLNLVLDFKEYSTKLTSIMFKRQETIEYYESLSEKINGHQLLNDLEKMLEDIQDKLLQLNKDSWPVLLEELTDFINTEVIKHRKQVVSTLYGNLFKSRDLYNLTFFNKVKNRYFDGEITFFFVWALSIVILIKSIFDGFFPNLFIK
ncbi:hypothetical protein [Paenibacillus sp. FSL K6-1558]|uniref:hypothetical protein n=1 Tax=Paenibacillus sp. FSL K6-1558 TaxID=2921473 RepID=UPI0030FA860E